MKTGFIYPPCEPDAPHNLLDNSYFPSWHLVNQYGYVSGSASTPWRYFIDRWRNASSSAWRYTLSIAGISLPAGALMLQKLGRIASGTMLTFAMKKSDGEIITVDGEVVYNADGAWKVCVEATRNNTHISIETRDAIPNVRVEAVDAAITLEWAALYEGIYTADTLPPYVPKGYGNELAECRKHFQRIRMGNGTFMALAFSKTSARTTVYLDEMRVTPTVTTNNPLNLVGKDNVKHTVTGMNVGSIGRTSMALVFTAEGLTSGEVYGAYPLDGNNAANVDFDANI